MDTTWRRGATGRSPLRAIAERRSGQRGPVKRGSSRRSAGSPRSAGSGPGPAQTQQESGETCRGAWECALLLNGAINQSTDYHPRCWSSKGLRLRTLRLGPSIRRRDGARFPLPKERRRGRTAPPPFIAQPPTEGRRAYAERGTGLPGSGTSRPRERPSALWRPFDPKGWSTCQHSTPRSSES